MIDLGVQGKETSSYRRAGAEDPAFVDTTFTAAEITLLSTS